MSFRSSAWVRNWTAALAFTAICFACLSVGRAEQLTQHGQSPSLTVAVKAFNDSPNDTNLQKVRSILVSDHGYNPYSDDLRQLENLVKAGKHREAIALFNKALPNLVLSSRAHSLASTAAKAIGDQKLADVESQRGVACLRGIRATGDGSKSRPFQIARTSDEADLLESAFHTQIASQGLIFEGDTKCDQVIDTDGNTYWFDVSMLCNRPEALPAPSAAAGGSGLASPTMPALKNPVAKEVADRGHDAYRAGRYDEAVAALNEAIELEPANAAVHVDRGNAYYAKRDYAQAIVDFSEAVRLEPNFAMAYSNRAFALNTLGESDQAITDFNAAIRIQPNFPRAYNGRGCAYKDKGMLDTAIGDFDAAIRLDPSYASAYENRSSAHEALGNKELSDADAAKARELRGKKTAPAASATASAAPRSN